MPRAFLGQNSGVFGLPQKPPILPYFRGIFRAQKKLKILKFLKIFFRKKFFCKKKKNFFFTKKKFFFEKNFFAKNFFQKKFFSREKKFFQTVLEPISTHRFKSVLATCHKKIFMVC